MSKHVHIISLLLCMTIVLSGPWINAQTGIVNTKHNLSVSGPGLIKATSEERICVFCHTPHNATPQTPLWNKNIEGINYDQYTPYTSSTLGIPAASQIRPTGSSRLCLSCHDGTLALGDVKLPRNQIDVPVAGVTTVPGGMPHTSPSYFGTSLANHHPISFSYYSALPNPELSPTPPQGLLYYGNGVIQCNTCHDPHDNSNKKFLAVSNVESGLCTLCHIKDGWDATSSHKMEDSIGWDGRDPNPWPRTYNEFGWNTVKKNGCENCHSPHSAQGQQRLLNCYTETGTCSPATQEGVCFPCHNGHMPPVKNIFAQLEKNSNHRVANPFIPHDPLENENPLLIGGFGHVECVDCHNPHAANNAPAQMTGGVTGRLKSVSGMSADGAARDPALYEYEVCFKCHGSSLVSRSLGYPIPRVFLHVNTRMEFQLGNASYHPVVGPGQSSNVPSLIDPPWNSASQILCTDCHSDDGNNVSLGPHGSAFAPILRKNNIITRDNIYSSDNFALCYRCHAESIVLSVLDDPFTFRKKTSTGKGGHVGHVQSSTAAGPSQTPIYAPCSACHDPHGVATNARLINFDKLFVTAPTGSAISFTGTGNGIGSCTLVCHGVEHHSETHFYP